MSNRKLAITAMAIITAGAVFFVATHNQPPPSFEDAEKSMTGRWIFNDEYCDARLPADGLIELRLEPNGIRSNNILAKGAWSSENDNDELRHKINDVLASLTGKCQAALPDSNFALIKFESFEQTYRFAYAPGSNLMVLVRDDQVTLGARYDEAQIRNLADPVD